MQNFFAQLTNNRRAKPAQTSGREIFLSLRMKIRGESKEVLMVEGKEVDGKLILNGIFDGQTFHLTKEK